jgi:hypothetical protein
VLAQLQRRNAQLTFARHYAPDHGFDDWPAQMTVGHRTLRPLPVPAALYGWPVFDLDRATYPRRRNPQNLSPGRGMTKPTDRFAEQSVRRGLLAKGAPRSAEVQALDCMALGDLSPNI